MIFLDPPTHPPSTGLEAFTPRRIAVLEEEIRTLCADLLDPHVGSDASTTWPISAPGAGDRHRRAARCAPATGTRCASSSTGPSTSTGDGMFNDVSAAAMGELHAYVEAQLKERQRCRAPTCSPISSRAKYEEDGHLRRLTLEEATMFSLLLASAGTRPWLADRVGRRGPGRPPGPTGRAGGRLSLVPNTVEELLRFEAPPGAGTLDDGRHRVHGQVVPPTQGAPDRRLGGRDERAFPDADRFDIHRSWTTSVLRLRGHFCLAPPWPLEGASRWRRRYRRFPQWSVDLDRAVSPPHQHRAGYTELPITF